MIVDIERWIPERWNQVVGNEEIVEYFQNMIWCVRKDGHRSGFNMIVTGPSRSGKTATVRLGLKSLGCLNLDFETLNPCHKCLNCRDRYHVHGTCGWESYVNFLSKEEAPTPIKYLHWSVDCARLTEDELNNALDEMRFDDGYIRVITLDECHRLARRNMDEKFLKTMEDFPSIWIAMSANVKKESTNDQTKLDKMFQNRFTYRLNTEKPSVKKLAVWLAERCEEWGIECDNPEKTLTDLARRSGQNPGMALQVLNKAYKTRNRLLTMDILDRHVFDLDD